MKYIIALLLVVLAGCSGGGGNSATAPTPMPSQKIVFYGDSIIYGLNAPSGQTIESAYSSLSPSSIVVNDGKPGRDVGMLLADYPAVVKAQTPIDILIIETGINDGGNGVPIAQFTANLTTLIQWARQDANRVYIMPPYFANSGELAALQPWIAAMVLVAQQQNVGIIRVDGNPAWYAPPADQYHPSANGGYTAIGDAIFSAINIQ